MSCTLCPHPTLSSYSLHLVVRGFPAHGQESWGQDKCPGAAWSCYPHGGHQEAGSAPILPSLPIFLATYHQCPSVWEAEELIPPPLGWLLPPLRRWKGEAPWERKASSGHWTSVSLCVIHSIIEYLLYAQPSAKCWGHGIEYDRKILALMELTFEWDKGYHLGSRR